MITCNAVKRGAKAIHLKDIVDAALAESAKNGISVGMHVCKLINGRVSANSILVTVINVLYHEKLHFLCVPN